MKVMGISWYLMRILQSDDTHGVFMTEARDMSMTNTLDPTNVYLVIPTCINLSFAAGTMLAMLYNSHHSTQIIKLDKIC